MKKSLISGVFVVLFAFTVCGCNSQQCKLETFNQRYGAGDYGGCSSFAAGQFRERKKPGGSDLLWALQAGSVERLQGDLASSTRFFDKAEAAMKYFDLNQSKILDGIGATAINDNAIPYLGQEYDGVMVNTYKGLNFIAGNEMELARVEFNRALDRQRRAKEKFNKEIARLRKKIESKDCEKNGGTVKRSVDNPEVNKILNERYPDLSAYEVYPDFVNPFTTYMSGLFFNLDGDYSKGVDLLKESYGMVPENEYIAKDLAATELALSGNKGIDGVCWVIFENGLGPVKNIWRIDLPVFLASEEVKYVGMALPKLSYRGRAYSHLVIEAGGNEYATDIVADMDRVIQTEFKQDYPSIVARAVMSATIKAAAQYVANEEESSTGNWVSLLAIGYSIATTTADVRVWTALPKEFQVARFDIPEDRKVVLRAPGGAVLAGGGRLACGAGRVENFPVEIELGACKNALVYVKVIRAGVAPVYNVTLF